MPSWHNGKKVYFSLKAFLAQIVAQLKLFFTMRGFVTLEFCMIHCILFHF